MGTGSREDYLMSDNPIHKHPFIFGWIGSGVHVH
jgi:hypothetical protein